MTDEAELALLPCEMGFLMFEFLRHALLDADVLFDLTGTTSLEPNINGCWMFRCLLCEVISQNMSPLKILVLLRNDIISFKKSKNRLTRWSLKFLLRTEANLCSA